MGPSNDSFARFKTTRWSVVLCAAAATDGGQQAWAELISSYWYPLYAFCRRSGNSHHDAQDLTQGFFTHLLNSVGGLNSVSPAKGRFRSFLIAAFKNYMANEHRHAHAIRRGGAMRTLSLEDVDFQVRYEREPCDDETPERLFERSWAESLLVRVGTRLASDYHHAGKDELFGLLEPHLKRHHDAISREEIGRRLQLSAAAVNMSLHRMRRRYGEILREEVAATVDDPADIDDELRSLMAAVSAKL